MLLVEIDDYCIQKVQIAAKLSKVPIEIKKNVTHDELLSHDAAAKSMVLVTNGGALSQHNAILKYIAECGGSSKLLGNSDIELSQVQQWIESSWQELEIPVHALLGVQKNDLETKAALTKQIHLDIINYLTVLEEHLSTKTYLVGERLSLADISIYVVFVLIAGWKLVDQRKFPSLFRWQMTVGSHPSVAEFVPPVQLNNSTESFVETSTKMFTTGKWDRHRIRIKELSSMGEGAIGKVVVLKGWIRTTRTAEKGLTLFVELSDGSTVRGVQLVMSAAKTEGMKDVSECGGVGASLSITGLVVASPAKGQTVEVHVSAVKVLGAVYGGDKGEIGAKNYPLSKKSHSLEYLREIAHLRPRTKVFSSAMRLRNAMAFATHKFFNERGFIYTHTPLITSADCEGAGEQFTVTTLLPDNAKVSEIPATKTGLVDFGSDFFKKRCCLTVSGQLNVETHACALSDVYTFGPTFRAEDSHTSRHLAEFWMIEPEICFADLADDMALAEDYVKFCTSYALEHCADDLAYFENEYPAGEKGLRERLRNVVENDFAQITYTEAVALLQKEIADGKVVFEMYPSWGDDLGSEHERYITEQVYKKPTIVINYPKGIKAFYMKLNDDNVTVAAMDVLVPRIGELIGGSQREDNLMTLEKRCMESGLNRSDIWWYAELRKYGTVPHAGFGLGFERLIMFVTGLENIRDVIPFPRIPGHAEF